MIAYNKTIEEFNNDVLTNNVVNSILKNIRVGISEQGAWQDAAIYMKNILELAGLSKDIEVGMELKIPITNNRIDFLIAGLDNDDKKNLIIIELKRWAKVTASHKENLINADDARYGIDSLHPSYQAYTYKLNLEAYNSVVYTQSIDINPCAYLHNLKDDTQIKDGVYSLLLNLSPVFCANDNLLLAEFIKKHVTKAYCSKLLYDISNGIIRPSKMLVDSLEGELKGNTFFTLLDKQEVVYQNIIDVINTSYNDNKKHVIIVKGGAGTGKSVIAIKLLNYFIKGNKLAYYITKNSSVTNTFGKILSGKNNAHLRTLFKSIITISRDRPVEEYDCLIIDEAHRLPKRAKSGNILLGEDLVKELIVACKKVAIFFIDEKQQVDIRDYATIENITTTAKILHATVHENVNLELISQFRVAGNDEYVNFIDKLLYEKEVETYYVNKDYDVKLFDNFVDFYYAIKSKIDSDNGKSRILSGDVFPWVSDNDPNAYDIVIDGIKLQWNKGPSSAYAIDEDQKYRVGHIDAVQGLEFNYIGLIIGNDLLYSNNKGIYTDYTTHPVGAGHFRRHGRRAPLIEDIPTIDKIIRNTYNVLLKRGIKGCYIYCMDKSLLQYLKNKVL